MVLIIANPSILKLISTHTGVGILYQSFARREPGVLISVNI